MSNLDKKVAEDYKRWKRNVNFLYEFVLAHMLEWPSTIIEWTGLPVDTHTEKDSHIHQCMFASRHLNCKESTVNVASVYIPNSDESFEFWGQSEGPVVRKNRLSTIQKRFGVYHPISEKVVVTKRVRMKNFVSNLKTMPQNPHIFACTLLQQLANEVYVFDHSKNEKCPCEFSPDATFSDNRNLNGPSVATGIDWNHCDAGKLLACSSSSGVFLHDLENEQKSRHFLANSFAGGSGSASSEQISFNDVEWNPKIPNVFAAGSSDEIFRLWDIRLQSAQNPIHEVHAHKDEVTSVAFCPQDGCVFVTASMDKTLALWDLRNLSVKLHSLTDHTNPLEKVSWSPHACNIIASKDNDQCLNLWDLNKIGTTAGDTTANTSNEGSSSSPELLFCHRGHAARVTDFAWNPDVPFMIGSVAEDNISQFWIPCEDLFI